MISHERYNSILYLKHWKTHVKRQSSTNIRYDKDNKDLSMLSSFLYDKEKLDYKELKERQHGFIAWSVGSQKGIRLRTNCLIYYACFYESRIVSEQPINIILPSPRETGICNPHFIYREVKCLDQDHRVRGRKLLFHTVCS